MINVHYYEIYSVFQFRGAYRRIIGRSQLADLQHSSSSNSVPQHEDDVPAFQVNLPLVNERTSILTGNVVTYIGGFVIRKVLSQLSCDQCAEQLMGPGDRRQEALIDIRDFGELMRPSREVSKLLCAVETLLRQLQDRCLSDKRLRDRIVQTVVNEMAMSSALPFPDDHSSGMNSHSLQLTRSVILCYLKVRLHHLSQSRTSREQGDKIRARLNKTILFSHQ